MNIAVCDDNVADRKQTERLLGRASDGRAASSGALFSDSYGNPDALLSHPMLYDIFLLDLCHTEGIRAADVAARLRAAGSDAPIVLLSSEIAYQPEDFPEGCHFYKKPLSQQNITEFLELAQAFKDSAEPRIEIRIEKETAYVRECEILYAEAMGEKTRIYMTDGRELTSSINISTFFDDIESVHPSFAMPNSRQVINCRYVNKFSFPGKAHLVNGMKVSVSPGLMPYVKQMQAEYFGKEV
jgi:DNA-binding LytR/AlgR family response regulator